MWVEKVMKEVAAANIFPQQTHIFLMNLKDLRRRMKSIVAAFDDIIINNSEPGARPPVKFLHAFAIKANPMQCVLETALECGMGLETASIAEFVMAERIFKGDDARKIVFDSPAKTLEEIFHAIQVPCYLNVDNFAELERIIELYEGKHPQYGKVEVKATIGMRINPQTVSKTQNALLATGGKVSKFGIPLQDGDNRERIIRYFQDYHDKINLKMLHVHSGSQGLSVDTMVDGVKAITALANDPQLSAFVSVVDIGGGFPVDFSSDDETVTVADYVKELKKHVPELFNPPSTSPTPRTIMTEFGRTVAAKSGVLVSRVEYVKMSGDRQIVSQHTGADLAVRTVWQPTHWPLRVFIYNEKGELKTSPTSIPTDVAGPCCNSGCVLTRAAELPNDIVPLKDLVVVHDVGGYYHSGFSLYNLRQMPACYTYDEDSNGQVNVRCVKKAQTVEETLKLFETDDL